MGDSGVFSATSYIGIGDPYVAKKNVASVHVSPKRGMVASGPTMKPTFDRFKLAFDGEKYVTPGGGLKNLMENRKGFRTDNGFCAGTSRPQTEFTGTIGGKHEYMPNGTGDRSPRVKITAEQVGVLKNIQTSPIKKGGFGVTQASGRGDIITIGAFPEHHIDGLPVDNYDRHRELAKAERQAHDAALGERKGFKTASAPGYVFDENVGHAHAPAPAPAVAIAVARAVALPLACHPPRVPPSSYARCDSAVASVAPPTLLTSRLRPLPHRCIPRMKTRRCR